MAVTIRLARHGQKKRPFYRIVATEQSSRRDGRFLEIVGTYNPMTQPAEVNLKEDRIKHWVSHGASQSQLVRSLIKKQIPDYIEDREKAKTEKTIARRAKRRQTVKARKAKS